MKRVFSFLVAGLLLSFTTVNAQLLKKIKQKAEDAIGKKADKSTEKKQTDENGDATKGSEGSEVKSGTGTTNLKVYSKFDFVPGATILYYDNFEKDNIGEAPLGWITSTSAEVVTIEGLEGNWLKMAATSAQHITRNKKQSWGNNFTVEFDLLIVKNTYDPRIEINLINTGGNMVTDEKILRNDGKPALNFSAILAGGNNSRASLYAIDKRLSDAMTENLPYSNTAPVHVSMCVQGKRFRMWWNDRKLYDLAAVSEEYIPNQMQFVFGSVGGSDFYLSNIRVAKDIPDTRAKFEEGKLVSNLLFYTGTAKLKPESMGSLLDVSKILKDATSPVKIIGHTDSDGNDATNLKLSQQRADAVKDILVNTYKIDESKLTTEGRGETQPIADNKSYEGKAQNRRVEFIFKAEADKYIKPSGTATNSSKTTTTNPKPTTSNTNAASTGTASVSVQSKLLITTLPYAQIIKSGESNYTFIASKEEGNSKENYIKIQLESVNTRLKPETFNFEEINKKNPLYGTKKLPGIKNTEAVLYYGATQKPYIYKFSPVIANGHMSKYFFSMPQASPNCKLVIEKVEDGKASGYFVFGIMIEGLKPIDSGQDGGSLILTDGFSGEMKCTFNNVPVY